MIDLALAQQGIEQIDARLARLDLERESLLALRAAWERYTALGTPSDQPAQGREGTDPAPVSQPDRASADSAGATPDPVKPEADSPLPAAAPPVEQPPAPSTDRRTIDKDCPRGCGRHFTWAAALASHVPICIGSATRYPCPKGCGRDFSHRKNAERHGKACRRATRKGAARRVDPEEWAPGSPATHGIDPFEPGSVARAASAANERVPARDPEPPAEAHGLIPEPRREPWIPKPEGTGSPPGDRVIKGGREKWICNRCPATFLTLQERDTHQATHPPVPDATPLRRASRGAVDQLTTT